MPIVREIGGIGLLLWLWRIELSSRSVVLYDFVHRFHVPKRRPLAELPALARPLGELLFLAFGGNWSWQVTGSEPPELTARSILRCAG